MRPTFGETPATPPPIDETKRKGDEPPTVGEQKTIALRGGGTLTLSASVKFFSLPRDDRDFVFEIIDKLSEYEAESEHGRDSFPHPSSEPGDTSRRESGRAAVTESDTRQMPVTESGGGDSREGSSMVT